jgi:hypothetical protein
MNNKPCTICNNPIAHYSHLFDEILCVECIEWAKAHAIVDITSIDEQYEEYVKSFPLNDPRD